MCVDGWVRARVQRERATGANETHYNDGANEKHYNHPASHACMHACMHVCVCVCARARAYTSTSAVSSSV